MCCCLSSTALKWIIYCSCLLILGIGCVLVWVGFLVQSSEFIQVLQFSYSGFIVIACGGTLIFISFFGIVGAWKQNKFFLSSFIIFSVIIGVLLITFGGVLLYVRSLSHQYLQNEDKCRLHFPSVDNTTIQASTVFCQLYCPCSLDRSILNVTISDFYKGSADNMLECNPCESIQTYNTSTQDELISWIYTDLSYTVNVTSCGVTATQYQNGFFSAKYQSYIPLLTWIENQFSCSGLCTPQKIFMFSDVNQGLPSGACYQQVNDWAQENFQNYGIISIILGVFQIIIILFSSTLCCCPKKRLETFALTTEAKSDEKTSVKFNDKIVERTKKIFGVFPEGLPVKPSEKFVWSAEKSAVKTNN